MADGKPEPIGIDLGTTFSCVSYYDTNQKKVRIIENAQGATTTPSYVAFTDKERMVGDTALNQATKNPENTVFDAKRLIGRTMADPLVQKSIEGWPFAVVEGPGQKPLIEVMFKKEKKQFKPEEISSMLLANMKARADEFLQRPITDVVVTVPAYFNQNQRQSTKDAAQIAGLNVMRIVNEPTAAALAYGFDRKEEKTQRNILIYDLGGGTFDVTILEIKDGIFTVKATNGDCHLGGEDFDDEILNYALDRFKEEAEIDIKSQKKSKQKSRALRRIRNECTKAKIILSAALQTELNVDAISDGEDLTVSLTRAKFEQICENHFNKTLPIVDTVLEEANLKKTEIDDIVLVGGSTRIPKIQNMLKDHFPGQPLDHKINPDEAVAQGAGILAHQIRTLGDVQVENVGADTTTKGGIAEITEDEVLNAVVMFKDVNPISQGLEHNGGAMNILIKRNEKIPCEKSKLFTNNTDYCEQIAFKIFQGERALVKDCELVGEFDLSGFGKSPARTERIKTTFSINEDGILKVNAENQKAGAPTKDITVSAVGALTPVEIARMIKQAEEFAEEDKRLAKNLKARILLEELAHRIAMHTSGKGTKIAEEAEEHIRQNKDANAALFEAYAMELKAKCPWL